MAVRVRWGVATHPGRVRPENEDNALAIDRAFIVADGMGGHRAGEVAAAMAVEQLAERLQGPGTTLDDVVAAVTAANADIYRTASENPDQHGMGTTVTGIVLLGPAPSDESGETAEAADGAEAGGDGELSPDSGATEGGDSSSEAGGGEEWALVNVGDSRTYLYRHGRLRRITVDHSYVQELVATGHITDDEARTHPRRNIVTRALGIDPVVRVDAWTLPVVRGDRFLVCSDGLVDEVRDTDIAAVLARNEDPQVIADELVAMAIAAGGRDNITVIVVDVLEGTEPPDPDAELDLEPAWGDGQSDSTWAVDAPEDEATEYADLAALVAGGTPPDAGAQPDADTEAEAGTDAGEATDAEAGAEAEGGTATASGDAADTADTAPAGTETGTSGAAPAPPGAPRAVPITDEVPIVPSAAPRRRRRIAGFLGAVGLIAILVFGFVIAAAYARRGYFIDFDDRDRVAIYRGRTDGFLWFDPTVEAGVDLTREQLDEQSIELVERQFRFDSREAAEEFVATRLSPTTTTTTTTTTTSTTTSTTSTTSTTVAATSQGP